MTIFIQDSARNNVASWMAKAIADRLSSTLVISPFTTAPRLPSALPIASRIVEDVQGRGGVAWLDPMTHVLQAPGVGHFRHYDRWAFWPDARGLLDTTARRGGHIEQVFRWQRALNAPLLAPTILLSNTFGKQSQWMLDLCKEALEQEPAAALAIAGDTHFWSQGADLDAFIGSVAQLGASRWFLTVLRPTSTLPAAVFADEVHGICRSVRSLQEDASVHLCHSDLAGLPGLAAGAASVGTGWDPRQRLCGYTDFVAQNPDSDGGGWFKRPTLEKLLCVVTETEFQLLLARNTQLALALRVGAVPPGPKEVFFHHLRVLNMLAQKLSVEGHKQRYETLASIYDEALAYWATARADLAFSHNEETWIRPYLDGLNRYAADEGWN